ncbi:hypothetical protein [Acrocarpospora catenulata]|uniref:hypothetical protein n=1 Tax=Acrocarpospora catenulata TaxID=2836182 RepID=UPI001BD9E98C|nr:hypothetical protein [Acrocarpospora catenulata]
MRRSVPLLAIVLTVSACMLTVSACVPGPVTPPQAPAPAVADVWRDFPVASALERPLIVLDALPLTDAQSKGRIPAETALPAGQPPSTHLTLQGTSRHVTLISAQEALTAIRAQRAITDAPEAHIAATTLIVAPFITDRGTLPLPAWEFRLTEGGTLKWPAMSTGHFWRLGSTAPSTMVVDLAVDGRNLTATFMESWGTPCPGVSAPQVTPVAVEFPSFVSIGLKVSTTDLGDCAQSLAARLREASLTLKEPLGNRVVVDFSGQVVPTTT